MIFNRKAQAAFEFMATYAWILIAVLVTVGALFYFNVLDPQRYLPEECEFGQNVLCEDWSVQKNTALTFTVFLKLKNNLEKSIELRDVSIIDNDMQTLTCDDNIELVCPSTEDFVDINWTNSFPDTFEGSWGVGKSCTLRLICEQAVIKGVKDTWTIDITFRRQTPTNDATEHTITGRLFSKPI